MKNYMKTLMVVLVEAVATTVWADVPFEAAQNATDADAQQYYIYQPTNQRYVKVVDGNVLGNQFTGDKFVFVESGKSDDCYYIYNASEKKYLYYTQTSGTANTKTTSSSAIKMTTNQSQANTWYFVADGENWDIVPGEVKGSLGTKTQGWNFRGGADYALNLYDRSDVNGVWTIMGNLTNAMPCATKVFSLPGKPFMHKLPTHEGDVITEVKGLPAGLQVYDRPNYKYIYGNAPAAGEYTYTVVLNGTDEQEMHLTVSEKLAQPTPFMGILTWNAFRNYIDQEVILQLADGLDKFGLKDLGYDHMCIDDCWATKNRVNGRLNIDTSKFPSMRTLVDEMHKRGLKIGIYSDAGEWTCSKAQPGSYGYEEVDAKDFVDWGFDLLKYDYCFATGGTTAANAETAYTAMGDALKKACEEAGKDPADFKFYMCEWGWRQPYIWAANTGASCWRATDDTRDFWSDTTYKGGVKQVINIFKNCWAYQGVNRWNDADMLVLGLHGTGYPSSEGGGDGYSAGLTPDEERTNFALWCMFASPLTLSNNITNLDGQPNNLTQKWVTNDHYEEDLAIITNKELIDVDQDPLGQGAEPIMEVEDEYIVFQKDMADGSVALSVTNLNRSQEKQITVTFEKLSALVAGKTYKMRDLWEHRYLDENGAHKQYTTANQVTFTVRPHDTQVYRLYDYEAEDVKEQKNTLRPTAVTPGNGSKVEELSEITITFAESVKLADDANVTLNGEKVTPTTVDNKTFTIGGDFSQAGAYILVLGEGAFVNESGYYNAEKTYTFEVVVVDHRYEICFDKEANATRTDRYLTSVQITDSKGAVQTATCNTTHKPYQDLTDQTFQVEPGEMIIPKFNWTGTWMHGYVYVDIDKNEKFDVEDAESPELVSYSYYQGKNAAGASIGNNPGLESALYNFKAPESAGVYRMRFKVDWDNIDPAGNPGPDNNILNNGGSITDVTLCVGDVTGLRLNEGKDENRKRGNHIYDLQGRKVNRLAPKSRGLFIQGGISIMR